MEKIQKLFNRLQTDRKNVLFTEEQLNEKLFKKIKKSKYEKDKEFLNIFNLSTNKKDI